jgi:hypothetical protein
VRLRDLWADPPDLLTHREVITYIQHLPPDGALGRQVLGEAADWTVDTHLTATMADLLAGANWQRAGAPALHKPKPIRRPRIPRLDPI